MDLRSIYISNGVGIYILLLLIYTSHAKIQRHRMEDRLFTFMVYGVLIACFMEVLSYSLDGRLFFGSIVLNYLANTYLYSVNLLLSFSVLMYVDLCMYGETSRIWKHYKPHIFIGICMFITTLVNFFVPISYYISEDNIYHRLPFSYVFYFVIMYYCISAMIMTHQYEKQNGDRTFVNINMFLLPILVGVSLQFRFYGLSLAWLSASIGLAGLFMMQQNELAYIDSLVDTYNRQYLNHILSSWVSRGISFTGMMIDLDHFKTINDQYGHSEGDKTLKIVANILKESGRDHEWVFRFAGDEFVVLKMEKSPEALSLYIQEVEKNLDRYNQESTSYPLQLSYGISYCESDDLDAFMKDMDKKMYEMKTEHHNQEGLS